MIHHSYVFVKYFFKKVNKAVKCGEAVTKKLPNHTGLGVLVVPVAGLEPARYRYRWILSYLLHTEYKRTQTPMEVVNGHLKARNY